jgi:hypothetical protein
MPAKKYTIQFLVDYSLLFSYSMRVQPQKLSSNNLLDASIGQKLPIFWPAHFGVRAAGLLR